MILAALVSLLFITPTDNVGVTQYTAEARIQGTWTNAPCQLHTAKPPGVLDTVMVALDAPWSMGGVPVRLYAWDAAGNRSRCGNWAMVATACPDTNWLYQLPDGHDIAWKRASGCVVFPLAIGDTLPGRIFHQQVRIEADARRIDQLYGYHVLRGVREVTP